MSHPAENDVPVWCHEHMEPYCPRHAGQSAESDAGTKWPACATYPNLGCVCRGALGQSKSTCTRRRTGDLTQIPNLPPAENDAPRCQATTERGTPCQKRLHASSDGEFWPHAGGHWFMSDDMYACLSDDHYDPVSVLTHGPLAHLDVPCPRVFPPAEPEPHDAARPHRERDAMTTETEESKS